MDYTNILNSHKYVMSLDTLDLALLPTTYTSRFSANTTSLWTVNNLNQNTNVLFEFEVLPKTNRVDDETISIETITKNCVTHINQSKQSLLAEDLVTTTCHICDIKVPAAYLGDHENSLKHTANVKIANVVLDRSRKHMLKKNTACVHKNESFYFCGPCASVVCIVNKCSHEKSKVHKQSVSLDRLLYELVSLYTDNEYENNEESSPDTDNKANGLKAEDENIENNAILISDISSKLHKLKENKFENYYIKTINKCVIDKSYVLSIVDNNVKISQQDVFDVTVPLDNFNGFLRIVDNFLVCLVCKMIIEDEIAHMVSDTHIKNIMTPLKDQHCIRNLDNSSSHCIICNKIVQHTKLHILYDETHMGLVGKCLVLHKKPNNYETDSTVRNDYITDSNLDHPCNELRDNNFSLMVTKNKSDNNITSTDDKINEDIHYCVVCNLEMHVNNLESHINGIKHAMNTKSNVHYQMRQEEGSVDLTCRICNIYIADDINQVIEHVATGDHCQKYKDLLYTNYIIPHKDNFNCKPCGLVVMKKNELFHMEKLTHVEKLTCLRETMSEKSINQKRNQTDNSVESPIKDVNYFCTICNVYVPNYPNNISDHNNGARHKKNVLNTIPEVGDAIKSSSSPASSVNMHYQMDVTENENNLICKVCKVVHKESNKCNISSNICNAFVTDSNFDHLSNESNGYRPSLTITENKPVDNNIVQRSDKINDGIHYCVICNLEMHVNNLESHINGIKHAMNTKSNVHYQMRQEEGSVDLTCRICNIYIADDINKVIEHVATADHCQKYKDLLYTNYIIPQKGNYYCKPCGLVVMKKNELFHIEKLTHEENLTCLREAMSEKSIDQNRNPTDNNSIESPVKDVRYFCTICNTYVPNNPNNISDHNNGARHKKNVLNTIPEVADSIKSSSSPASSIDIHSQMQDTENEKNLTCKVCKVVHETSNTCNISSTICNSFVTYSNFDHLSNEPNGYRPSLTITENKPVDNNIVQRSDKINEGIHYCVVCNLEMHVNNLESHINGIKHAMNTKSNVHYQMRQEEGYVDLTCRICNIYIADDINQVIEHVATADHCQKYKDLLYTNYIIPQKGNYYCKPCGLVVMKKNELFHIEKLTHEENLTCLREAMSEKSIDQNRNPTDNNSIESPVKDVRYFCTICNTYVPNNPNNISDHNNGARHKKNVLNKIPEVADSIKSSSSTASSINIHYQMDATENEKNLICKVCKSVVPNKEDSITEHITGKKHESALISIMNENYIESYDEKLYCKACNLYIDTQKLFIHISQNTHLTLLRVFRKKSDLAKFDIDIPEPQATTSKTEDKQINENILNIESNTDSIDKAYLKFKYHFTEIHDKTILNCKICFDIDIPNNAKAVATHTAGQAHIKGYMELMSDNFIFEIEDHTHFCAICVCLVPLKGEILHVQGLRHMGNYNNANNKTHCDICNLNTSVIDMPHHLCSAEHITRVMKRQSLLHYCEFCKALTQKNKADEHVQNCHKIAVKDKICFCTICDPFLPVTK